ncbi:uncharacterized protein [Solanum tuberosum]|uniref:Ribosomal RNA-processing protein 7 C-terminal domain-containing protein n=1 Tax=Solanum tuberosum TaxID=4113 RepID=M1AMU9_SOLTU|nr:PREDICTED: uncharacterized protein LOC102589922 isoform X3 [Solanum tuberosum]
MGAKDLERKLKKKKNKDGESQTMNSNFVQNEENFPKVTKEKKRKKKNLNMQNRRSKDDIDECHIAYHKDESNNADGEKKKSKSSKQKRKSNTLAESGGVNQSNEIEDDEIGQENTISSEPDNQETRKSKRKKRKSDKKAGKAEVDGVPKRQREWVADYYQNRPGLDVLQERIDEFIIDYEAKKEQEKKEKEALAAEDGWTVVVHHKGRKKTTDSETGIAVGSVSQAAVMDNVAKKKNKDVGLDFYRFQKREAKRNEIMVLQSKFEQDKKRIQQLRAARKFRPY